MNTETYTLYKEIGFCEGEEVATFATKPDAVTECNRLNEVGGEYYWVEKVFAPSPAAFDFDEHDLETERRHAEKEGRQTRRIVAIGDNSGVLAVAANRYGRQFVGTESNADYSNAVTNWLGGLEAQYAVDDSIADDNRAMRGVM